MYKIVEDLKALVEKFDSLELTVREAQSHILRNISKFSMEKLECMAMDGLIQYQDIPENLRSPYVNGWISHYANPSARTMTLGGALNSNDSREAKFHQPRQRERF